MYPTIFTIPVWLLALFMGGAMGASLLGGAKRRLVTVVGAVAGAALAGAGVYQTPFGASMLSVHSYGAMVLAGFVCGVWIAARRAPLIGVAPWHCLDVAVYGIVIGLAGARLFHVLMNWNEFNPFIDGFKLSRMGKMFKIWEGGLVFYGALVTIFPWAWFYCKWKKLPVLAFLDLAAPSVIAGQALGRIGCFLNGCCYGRVCPAPWAVSFPPKSPAYEWHVSQGLIAPAAASSLPVHPSQLYAFLAAALTAGFLYAYWPRRRFDGQILSMMLIMAGSTRFFEELLRDDDVAAFPSLSATMTIAQWFAIGIVLFGGCLYCGLTTSTRRRGELLR